MRLIDTTTEQLVWVSTPPEQYAILSHTWDAEEMTFDEVQSRAFNSAKPSFAKFQGALRLARKLGHRYLWIDTCCIDKTSSAELSESINSMFQWYRKSTACFVYLSDFAARAGSSSDQISATSAMNDFHERLSACRWFTRSWTLQELIAPPYIAFYSQEWQFIGDKTSLAQYLTRITHISIGVLSDPDGYQSASVAQRMSWAAGRQATREEDRSYALFGIFDINLAPLYGEGGNRAFRRLQEEIIRTGTDDSVLAWSVPSDGNSSYCPILAPSPDAFKTAGNVVHFLSDWAFEVGYFSTTPRGLSLECPVVNIDTENMLLVLSSRYVGDFSGPLGIPVAPVHTPFEPSGVRLCYRQKQEVQVVTGFNSETLRQLPRIKIHIIQNVASMGGRGRGLGSRIGLPRVWLRSLARDLSVYKAAPGEVWRPGLRIFETSDRPATLLRRRVLVLSDQVEPYTHHVITLFFQVIDQACHVGITAYAVVATKPIPEVVAEALSESHKPEQFNPFDIESPIQSRRSASASTRGVITGIRAQIVLENVLGELVHVIDVSRIDVSSMKSAQKLASSSSNASR